MARSITLTGTSADRKLIRVATSDTADGAHLPLGGGEPVEIVPLTVVARSFPPRPSALPDVRDFVRRQLTETAVADEDVRNLCDRVAQVLLDAAGAAGSIQVSLRIFPAAAEVDVLFAADVDGPPVPEPAGPTAAERTAAERTAAERTAGAGSSAVRAAGRIAPGAGRVPIAAGRLATGAGHIAPGAARVVWQVDGRAQQPDPDARAPESPGAEAPPTFAVWLAARLRREGLSIQAAARRLEVSAKTVSRWLSGTTEPRLRDLYRIREVFGEPPIH